MKNKEFWKTVIHIIVTILTALGAWVMDHFK